MNFGLKRKTNLCNFKNVYKNKNSFKKNMLLLIYLEAEIDQIKIECFIIRNSRYFYYFFIFDIQFSC